MSRANTRASAVKSPPQIAATSGSSRRSVYAFSEGRLNDVLVNPSDVANVEALVSPMIVHELGFYLGAGLSD